MGIRIDCREAKLIQHFAGLKHVIKVAQLPVADAVIENSAGSPVALLERKTFSDFCTSLTSGRYREQRNRLKSVRDGDPTMQLAYILEGFPQWHSHMCRDVGLQKRVYGALENMVFCHGIALFPTADVAHTCDTLVHLAAKLAERADTALSEPMPARKVTIKAHLFASQLALIPGISTTTASSLAGLYPTAKALVDAIREDRSKVLTTVENHAPKSRKLGKKVASALVDAFS